MVWLKGRHNKGNKQHEEGKKLEEKLKSEESYDRDGKPMQLTTVVMMKNDN